VSSIHPGRPFRLAHAIWRQSELNSQYFNGCRSHALTGVVQLTETSSLRVYSARGMGLAFFSSTAGDMTRLEAFDTKVESRMASSSRLVVQCVVKLFVYPSGVD
jgi:hypothetical protein